MHHTGRSYGGVKPVLHTTPCTHNPLHTTPYLRSSPTCTVSLGSTPSCAQACSKMRGLGFSTPSSADITWWRDAMYHIHRRFQQKHINATYNAYHGIKEVVEVQFVQNWPQPCVKIAHHRQLDIGVPQALQSRSGVWWSLPRICMRIIAVHLLKQLWVVATGGFSHNVLPLCGGVGYLSCI